MSADFKKFNTAEIKKFLTKTGFPFEMKMAKTLRCKSYDINVGETFIDLEGNKKREIDIIAGKNINNIRINFIIECKQSLKDAWIFFSPEEKPGRYWSYLKYSPSLDFDDQKKCFDKIHVFDHRIPLTKNFVTFNGKKKSDPTHINDAIQKVIKATIDYMAKTIEIKKRNLFFPVVLFSGNMFTASYPGSLKVKKENHIQYGLEFEADAYKEKRGQPRKSLDYESIFSLDYDETARNRKRVRDVYSNLHPYHLVDFVGERTIISYLKLVEEEVKNIDIKKWNIRSKT